MNSLASDLARLGGLARRSRLRALGHSDGVIRRMTAVAEIRIIRRTWVAGPSADPFAVRAIELGGVLGGESALRSRKVWVSHDTGLCVAVPSSASRLPALAAGEYRVQPRRFSWPGGWRQDVVPALEMHARRVETAHAIASIDSALHLGLLTADGVAALFERLPKRCGHMRRMLEGRCESGIETLVRLAAQNEGWRVEVQVPISGVGRVDLLINGWLAIETDGDTWHSTPEQRARDRARDAALVRRGMRWHRFGYEQVMHDIDGCVDVIRNYLLAGR